jgi:hypothetical protein
LVKLPDTKDAAMITAARLTISIAVTIAIWLIATILIARAQEAPLAPARFKGWQRIWQCNDIRVTETVNEPGVIHYDLGGTIWGGSQFVLDINRNALYFNGRQCLPLQGW